MTCTSPPINSAPATGSASTGSLSRAGPSTATPRRTYEVASKPFRLTALKLDDDAPTVTGTTATVRARYPDPGAEALTFLPRLVTTGTALLSVNGRPVVAEPDAESAVFEATVPAGADVSLLRVEDGCGNATE